MSSNNESSLKDHQLRSNDQEVHHQAKRKQHPFQTKTSAAHLNRLQKQDKEKEYGLNLQVLYLGITGERSGNLINVAFSAHDGTYNIDFAVVSLEQNDSGIHLIDAPRGEDMPDGTYSSLPEYIGAQIYWYSQKYMYKFVGAGISGQLVEICPELPSRLWSEHDIIPIVFQTELEKRFHLDEEADSMARKSIMLFGPLQQPRLQVAHRNEVEVDCGGLCQLVSLESYRNSVRQKTWDAATKYVSRLKDNKIRIAFFSSTPQGGGVALMRHALIRYFRTCGVDCKWYVPRPKPEIFRITKTNHNILQGVADPTERLTEQQQDTISDWVESNSNRFWVSPGGPLEKGGADVIIVDDPQMPDLVRIAKEQDPDRLVIFRSHIQVRSDLINKGGNPTAEVWQWLWEKVQLADVFISHPVREFVPSDVPLDKLGYMPATTDWLDGLNKELAEYNLRYYFTEFNTSAHRNSMPKLEYPARPYILQVARFDPSKGIPVVIAAYAELRRKYLHGTEKSKTPQLILAGHGAVDDPDAIIVFDSTMELLETEYSDIRDDIIVLRVGPVDQILNALMTNAYIALQLSTREGFEVKVSEALHHGIPIIASRVGGIPLQVDHGKNGYLVKPGEHEEAARYLHELFTDDATYDRMSTYAKDHVSDEVSTVGNAISWMYLASELATKKSLKPRGRRIYNLAREEINIPITKDEAQLPDGDAYPK